MRGARQQQQPGNLDLQRFLATAHQPRERRWLARAGIAQLVQFLKTARNGEKKNDIRPSHGFQM